MKQAFLLIVVTMIPALELRASIPFGMLYGSTRFGIESGALGWPAVAGICMAANILLGWAVFLAMQPAMRVLDRLGWFRRVVHPVMARMQQRLKPYVERYGTMGVAVFIGIPLPGSGVYTGAVGAYLLGLPPRQFALANVFGVIAAGLIVTGLCLLIAWGFTVPSWLHWIMKEG